MTTPTALKKKKQELLASQVSNLVSETNENLLRVNVSKFFTDLEAEIQKALLEYWSDTLLLQGHVNLILAPIHEKHQEYYELLLSHKLSEFKRGVKTGTRLVERAVEKYSMKASKPVKFTYNQNSLFGTLQYTEERLEHETFTASESTLSRVDGDINRILTDGYKSGKGIDVVGRQITERFDQLRTWEAKRIARTEIHTAQNQGIMNSYESLGVEYTQWTATHDARTRVSHMDLDGEIIPFGGVYSNGLKFPGDTGGPIREWVNCRCANAPFVLPVGMMAPSFSPFTESDLIPIKVEPTVTKPQLIETERPIKQYTESDEKTHRAVNVYEYENHKIVIEKGVDFITSEEIMEHINTLPKKLTSGRVKDIYISDTPTGKGGEFDALSRRLTVYRQSDMSKRLVYDNINHELAHSIDIVHIMKDAAHSLKEKYEKIFKEDNKHHTYINKKTGKKRIPKKFPTDYAARAYLKFSKRKNAKNMFMEDFAESTRCYLNPKLHDEFVKNFPNRAEYLESIYGKPKFDENSPLYKALKEEGLI